MEESLPGGALPLPCPALPCRALPCLALLPLTPSQSAGRGVCTRDASPLRRNALRASQILELPWEERIKQLPRYKPIPGYDPGRRRIPILPLIPEKTAG